MKKDLTYMNGSGEDLNGLQHRILELEEEQSRWEESERALRKSETLLLQIAANYPNSYMSIVNKDLTIGFTSGQEFKKQNLNPDDFVGITLEQVFGEKTPIVRDYYLKTFNGEETSFELYINDQYQHYKTVPLQNEAGEIEQILVVVENITERKKVETALRESEKRYRTLFETMAQGVVYQDADGYILSANPAAERILGLSLNQMQGRTSLDPRWRAIHEDGTDFSGDTHPAMLALKTGKPVVNVIMGVFHPKEEDYRWININAMPQFRNGDDKPYQVYATFEDVTEQKRAEAQSKRVAQEWTTTFDAISDGIFLMDARHKILRCNRALKDIVGRSYGEILGTRCWEVVHDTKGPIKTCPMLHMKKTGARAEEVISLHGRWFNIYIDPMRDAAGEVIGSVHVMTDITEKKQAEDALRQRTQELGERVKELNCLYGISALIELPGITLDEILQGSVHLIPHAWQYPEITCARICFGRHIFVTENFTETPWRQVQHIIVHGEQTGKVEVFFKEEKAAMDEGPFMKEERSLLNAIAGRLGRVAERLQARAELTTLATTDPLTGVFNRRHFFNLAEKELERARRYGHPISCIMFDVDSFKEINDAHGHIFGDQILLNVVTLCQESIRQIDVFARFGGDEFIILLPETDLQMGQQVANRICNKFASTPTVINTISIPVTLSVGFASLSHEDELKLDILLKRVDQALYQAKENGKNRVSVWQAE